MVLPVCPCLVVFALFFDSPACHLFSFFPFFSSLLRSIFFGSGGPLEGALSLFLFFSYPVLQKGHLQQRCDVLLPAATLIRRCYARPYPPGPAPEDRSRVHAGPAPSFSLSSRQHHPIPKPHTSPQPHPHILRYAWPHSHITHGYVCALKNAYANAMHHLGATTITTLVCFAQMNRPEVKLL